MKTIFTIIGFLSLTLIFTGCTANTQENIKIDANGINIGGKEGISISNSGVSVGIGTSGTGEIIVSNSGVSVSLGESGNGINITTSGVTVKTDALGGTDAHLDVTTESDTTVDSSMLEQDDAMNSGSADGEVHIEATSSTTITNTGNTILSSGSSVLINNTNGTRIETR